MAKLIAFVSFFTLCCLNYFDKAPDFNSASLRLALALIFAVAIGYVAREELEERIG